MGKEEILIEIEEAVAYADLVELDRLFDLYLGMETEDEASKTLAMILYSNYNTFSENNTVRMMEMIIRKCSNLATLRASENFLFRISVLRGSVKLYNCFIKEGIEPFLLNFELEDRENYYSKLAGVAEMLTNVLFKKYSQYARGIDYNGAFEGDEGSKEVLLVNKEDYELMDDIIEKYNTIVGRRDIIKNLIKRSGQKWQCS